jgi:hypothetical protein
MRTAVMTVYVVALLMQIMGVYYVIHDAVKSRANVNVFSETWGTAGLAAQSE